MGETLVSAASNELLTDSIKNLKKSIIDPTTYTCTAEANYSFNQGRGNLHGVGDRVNLYNKGYDDSYRSSRVIGYEFSLDIPFDGAKYYVGEKPSYSRLNAMESKIEELVYNGQSYLNGNGGSGRSIYIIKSYDRHKEKIQAARDYARKSYRVIRKVSKNGFMVQRDKNADKHFLDGIDWAEKEIFKDLIHNANEVPQIGRGRILAYSRDCGYRNLYNLYDMMYKTDCGTYQEMWELEVKAYYLDGWIYADELFDLIIKGGDSK